MGKKVDYDKLAMENFRLAMNATMEMKSYSEKLSEDGINETSFFCIAVRVYSEKDQNLIKATLQMMALSLADSEKFGGDIEKAENHIIERGQYFTQLIEDILNNPYQFDPNPNDFISVNPLEAYPKLAECLIYFFLQLALEYSGS